MLKFINEKCNINLDIEFINELLEEQKQLVKINENLISTIDYLSKKYELIVLSNWFGYVQKERLKKAKIYNYFKEIYGGDIEYRKPDIRAFKRCIKNDIENEECVICLLPLIPKIKKSLPFPLNTLYFA